MLSLYTICDAKFKWKYNVTDTLSVFNFKVILHLIISTVYYFQKSLFSTKQIYENFKSLLDNIRLTLLDNLYLNILQ